jgi:hypothetical protein
MGMRTDYFGVFGTDKTVTSLLKKEKAVKKRIL